METERDIQLRRITNNDIKEALLDQRFRDSLPEELQNDIIKFMKNPGCKCNTDVYKKVMLKARKQVAEYFPTKEAPTEEEVEKEVEVLSKNNWQVINCSIYELSDELRKLGAGRKQLDIARFEDQVTIVVNHLESVY